MDLKKYNKLVIFIMIFIFVMTISAIVYNISSGHFDNIKVKLYFVETSTSTLKPEERTISLNSEENSEITSKVLEELKFGPKSQSYKKSIPNDVNILGAVLEGQTITVNLSSEFNNLKASDAVFCKTSLIYTLTNLEFIEKVKILVDGKDLLNPNGEVVGPESMEDIVMNPTVAPEKFEKEIIKLYFSNKDYSELVSEEREIEYNPTQKAKYIVEQLISGPKNSDLVATIPSETKIRDIKLKEGICYLDLSKDFIDKHSGGSVAELMTIQSIVNSLTEISEIKKVQFLIEGEKQQEFAGHLEFSKPFERTIKDDEA